MIILQKTDLLLGRKELEQLQQMLNLDDEQTSLKPLVTSTHDNLNSISSEDNLRPKHLNI